MPQFSPQWKGYNNNNSTYLIDHCEETMSNEINKKLRIFLFIKIKVFYTYKVFTIPPGKKQVLCEC